MNTYFLSDATIDAYLLDLLRRLDLMANCPTMICAVTESGIQLLTQMTRLIAKSKSPKLLEVNAVSVGKTPEDEIRLLGCEEKDVEGAHCLLIDSAVHTGRLMKRSRKKLLALGAAEISSYALVMKKGSLHIPTFWGVMIDDVDRALFSLDEIPNNRLAGSDERGQQAVSISVLDEEACAKPPVKSGLDSIDRITWSDRLFDMVASPAEHLSRSFLLEKANEVIGFLTIHLEADSRYLVIDEVALDLAWQKKKLGGVLLRFACTLARHHNCKKVRLNGIEKYVSVYSGAGFKPIPGREKLKLNDEIYYPMEKTLLHAPLDGHDPEV